MVTQDEFYCGCRRGKEHAKLIDKSWEQAAHCIGRELVQVGRDDAERTLDTGLHQIRSDYKHAECGAKRPCGDRKQRDYQSQHDGVSSAYLLRQLAEDKSSENCADVVENRYPVQHFHAEDCLCRDSWK